MDQQTFINLLAKQFMGEISLPELQMLEDLKKHSPEHARIAEQYQQAWQEVPDTGGTWPYATDLDADYAQLKSKLALSQQSAIKNTPTISIWHNPLLRVAAAIMLVATAIGGYYQFMNAPQSIIVSADGQEVKSLTLPDGSKVWIHQGGKLEYAANLATATVRRVKLSGEAFFEVTHDAEHPFSVETDEGGVIEVLGTEFDVRSTEKEASVLVRSGKVRFSPDGKQQGAVITAGKKATLLRGNSKMIVSNVTSFNALSWKNDGLEFIQTPMAQVVEDLNDFYKVHIELENKSLANCLHTAPLTNQPIEKVLESLAITYQFKVSKTATGHFVLQGGSCN